MSNFLGDIAEPQRVTAILSGSALVAREGVNLQKGMTYRDGGQTLSVFLVLPHDGAYTDEWNAESDIYSFEGHDSTTVSGGKQHDQMLMYESGRVSDNGKFYKAAQAYRDEIRAEPLQVQIYEKLDAGVWYDKGIFNLIDARQEIKGERRVVTFFLVPADASEGSDGWDERMMPAALKSAVWKSSNGRCDECGSQEGLRFVPAGPDSARLKCADHSGRRAGLL